MAGALMQAGEVDGVMVGADRITANGDTANKIGTYSLAAVPVSSNPILCSCTHVHYRFFAGLWAADTY